jgi:hypothetical protein
MGNLDIIYKTKKRSFHILTGCLTCNNIYWYNIENLMGITYIGEITVKNITQRMKL